MQPHTDHAMKFGYMDMKCCRVEMVILTTIVTWLVEEEMMEGED